MLNAEYYDTEWKNATPEISLILPAYNEASRQETPTSPRGDAFRRAIDSYQMYLTDSFDSWELLVVDDGSTDETSALSETLGVTDVLSYIPNQGRGHALRMGYLGSHGNVRIYTDSDGSYAPTTIHRLFEEVEHGADIAVAYRSDTQQHDSRLRSIGHTGMHKLCELIAPTGAKDPQAGAKAFTSEAAQIIWGDHVNQKRWAADRQALFYAHKLGMRVAQVGAEITPVGDSRVDIVKDAIDMVADSVHIRLELSPSALVKRADKAIGQLAEVGKSKLTKVLENVA
ncbi:MAG: glycosyltransferase [bacterium]|nr:glycosyltransferase [bacterium]